MVHLTTTCGTTVTHWELAGPEVQELIGPWGLKLKEWRDLGRLETVKSGPHREVFRLNLPLGRFYIKHYKVTDWKTVLRHVVRPCRAELEWRAARRIGALGISTFDPLAVGRTIVRGLVHDSYLISRAIEQAVPLDEFALEQWPAYGPKERRRIASQIAASLGNLAGVMHRNAILHRDFHPGNVLVQVGSPDAVRLWLVDLHAVLFPARLRERQRRHNLAQLVPFFDRTATRSDRARFFRAYWNSLRAADDRHNRTTGGPYRAAARRTEAYCQKAALRAHRRRDSKWARGNRRLIIADSPAAQCRGLAFLGRPLLESIRDDPEQLFRANAASAFAECRTACVTLPVGDGQLPCVVTARRRGQRATTGFFRETARRGAHPSFGRHAWETGHALIRRGIDTPKPILFVDTDRLSYLVTEQTAGGVPLDRFVCGTAEGTPVVLGTRKPHQRYLASVCRVLARQLRRLHDDGFDSPCLSAGHIRVAAYGADIRVWLVSLDGIRRRRYVSFARRSAALASLNASLPPSVRRTERLRFLKHYLQDDFGNRWKRVSLLVLKQKPHDRHLTDSRC